MATAPPAAAAPTVTVREAEISTADSSLSPACVRRARARSSGNARLQHAVRTTVA